MSTGQQAECFNDLQGYMLAQAEHARESAAVALNFELLEVLTPKHTTQQQDPEICQPFQHDTTAAVKAKGRVRESCTMWRHASSTPQLLPRVGCING